MKRFHVHAHVEDLQASVAFYSRLFAAEPARLEADYAKWMLDDPRVNFAISTRGGKVGVDHLGFQTDTEPELAELEARALSADRAVLQEGAVSCCYARSTKHWVVDPQGIAWERPWPATTAGQGRGATTLRRRMRAASAAGSRRR